MMCVDPLMRISSAELMVHPWIVGEDEVPQVELVSVEAIRSTSDEEARHFQDDLAREVEEHRRLLDRGDEPVPKRASGEEEDRRTPDLQIGRKGK